MFRPGGDLPQFRPGGVLHAAPSTPGMNMGPAFVPPPIPGRAFLMPQYAGGLPGFPPPPVSVPVAVPGPMSVSVRVPVPVPALAPTTPSPSPAPPPPPPLPSGHPPPFIPPLPHSPPADVPPPPPAGPPPSPPPPPAEDSSAMELLPPEPFRPNDPEMLKNIEVLAAFVVKNGPQFESMARAKQAGDPKFAFLFESEVGSEAVIGHEYYKWKKQTLELHLRLEAEIKVNKHLDQGKPPGRIQQPNRMTGQPVFLEEAGSPTMSDMDMEDDFATPSPKKEPVGQLGNPKVGRNVEAEKLSPRRAAASAEAQIFLQEKGETSGIRKFHDAPQKLEHPGSSEELGPRGGLGRSAQTTRLVRVGDETRELHEKTDFLDKRELRQDWEHPWSSEELGTRAALGRSPQTMQFPRVHDETREHHEKTDALNKREPKQLWENNDRSGLIMNTSFSDTSDTSGDWELPKTVNKTGIKASDLGRYRTEQDQQREETAAIPDRADNVFVRKVISQDADKPLSFPDLPVKQVSSVSQERPVTKVSRWGDPWPTQLMQPVKESRVQERSDVLNVNEPPEMGDRGRRQESASPSQHNSFSDASNTSKDWDRPRSSDGTGDRGVEDARFGAESDQHIEQETVNVDEFGRLVRKGASESDSDGGRPPPNRKRRSFSRSRSRSPGKMRRRRRSFSRSPRRSFSRSPSRSFSRSPCRSFSRSPRRSFSPSARRRGRWSQSHSRSPRWRRSLSRTPPRDLRWGGMGRGERDWRGDREFQERGRRGGRGGGPNICFNYARGRCFRGSSCRFLHQDRRFVAQEREFLSQEARAERPEAGVYCEYTEVDKEINMMDKEELIGAAQKSDVAEEVAKENVGVEAEEPGADMEVGMEAEEPGADMEVGMEAEEPGADMEVGMEAEEPGADMEETAAVQTESPTQDKTEEKGEVEGDVDLVNEDVDLVNEDVDLVNEPEVKEPEVSTEAVVAVEPELSSEIEVPEKPTPLIEELGSEEVRTEVSMTKKLDARTDAEWALPEEDVSPIHHRQGEALASEEVRLAEKVDARSAAEWSLPQGDESQGQSRQSEASSASVPALAPLPAATLLPMPPPLSQPRSMGQSIPLGNPALMGQPYMSTGQLYPPGNLTPSLHQQSSSLHHPLPSGNILPYAQASSLRQPMNNANANVNPNLPIQNSNLLQPFPAPNQLSNLQLSVVSGTSGPRPPYPMGSSGPSQQYPMGSSGPSQQAFLPGPPTHPLHDMPPLPQNRGTPMQPSYGASFPGQSGFGQNPPGFAQNPPSVPQNLNLGKNPNFPQNPNISQNPPFTQIPSFPQNPSFTQNPSLSQNPSFTQNPGFTHNPNFPQNPSLTPNPSLAQNPSFVQNPNFTQKSSFIQNPTPHNQPVFPPRNEPLSFPSNLPFLQPHGIPTNSGSNLAPVQHGLNSNLSLPTQQSVFTPSLAGDTSKQFTFPSLQQDVYPRPAITLSAPPPIQNPTPWVLPESRDAPVEPVSELPATKGQSASYMYPLTTIPPLSNLIRLPGVSDISASGDQYDPLSDSLDPGPPGAFKSMAYPPKPTEGAKFSSLSNAMPPRLENVSPGPVVEKVNILMRKPDSAEADIANINEAAADPGVGIVENVSPPDDNRNWSPGQPVEGAEIGQDQAQTKSKKSNRGLKLLRSAVAEYVKEVLKPTWREGHMSKEAFKTIAKKAVDKVTGALPSHHIPKSQEKVDQFMASSRTKISKLVQGYVDKYLKA